MARKLAPVRLAFLSWLFFLVVPLGGAAIAQVNQTLFVEVSPARPTTADAVTIRLYGTHHCAISLDFDPPTISPGMITIVGGYVNFFPCPGIYDFNQELTLPPLPAGAYLVQASVYYELSATALFEVRAPATVLPLSAGRFQASIEFTDPRDGSRRSAQAVQLTGDSGYFWFFGVDNIEVTLKVVDGQRVNGHVWVFAASMTDVPFTITVRDLAHCDSSGACVTRTYTQAGGANQNFIDVDAFAD